jgi:hypothetical protein
VGPGPFVCLKLLGLSRLIVFLLLLVSDDFPLNILEHVALSLFKLLFLPAFFSLLGSHLPHTGPFVQQQRLIHTYEILSVFRLFDVPRHIHDLGNHFFF